MEVNEYDGRTIVRLTREVGRLEDEIRDLRLMRDTVDERRRDRTLMEALDTIDEAIKRAESSAIEIGLKSARMAVRALMDRPIPPVMP